MSQGSAKVTCNGIEDIQREYDISLEVFLIQSFQLLLLRYKGCAKTGGLITLSKMKDLQTV